MAAFYAWIEFRSSRVLSLDQCYVGLDKSDAGLLKGLMLGWGKFDVSLASIRSPDPQQSKSIVGLYVGVFDK